MTRFTQGVAGFNTDFRGFKPPVLLVQRTGGKADIMQSDTLLGAYINLAGGTMANKTGKLILRIFQL